MNVLECFVDLQTIRIGFVDSADENHEPADALFSKKRTCGS
jgi:hypothetical protein